MNIRKNVSNREDEVEWVKVERILFLICLLLWVTVMILIITSKWRKVCCTAEDSGEILTA